MSAQGRWLGFWSGQWFGPLEEALAALPPPLQGGASIGRVRRRRVKHAWLPVSITEPDEEEEARAHLEALLLADAL